MSVLIIIVVTVVWTTARHEGSHGLAAWLEGAEISDMRLLPGLHPDLGFYFGYVEHSGGTTWLTEAAPFFADVLVLVSAALLLRNLRVGPRGGTTLVVLGLVSPLADLVYNYQGGFWREGTDVWNLLQALPNVLVHGFFLFSFVALAIILRASRKWVLQGVSATRS